MSKICYLLIIFHIIIKIYSQEIPLIGNIYNRKKISLNGKWKYIIDVQEEGYYGYRMELRGRGFFMNEKPKYPDDHVEYSFDTAPEMEIPSDWNTQINKLFFYEGTIWFKKSFNYTINPNKKLILYFGGVNYESIVYVNGILIGKHIGGFTPFNFDITKRLRNGENFIILKIDNKRKIENIPTLIFDWWNYGGITRNVYLLETNHIYIQNYHFDLNKLNKKEKEINITIELNKNVSNQIIEVTIPELKIKKSFKTNNKGIISDKIIVNNLILWNTENPKLYKVILKLGNDELIDNIGFRTIEVLNKSILLNGAPIFLRGISLHEEKPNGGGRMNSLSDAKKILSWVKELGCNYIRLAHYPHNEYMIREAEKEGILVWSELPLYWTIAWENKDTYNNAKNQLTDMILRDINRANIIIWSIANETPCGKARDFFLSNLISYVRKLDNTRLITMALEVTETSNDNLTNILNDTMAKNVDIISINEYIGWYRDIINIDKMKWIIPFNKPVIISEFGAGAKYGKHGDVKQRWTEEFQNNVYINNLKMLEKIDGLAGISPWILKDFRSPRRVLTGIQDFYNRKGLISDKGEKKMAFNTLKNWYNKKKEEWKKNKVNKK